MLNQFKFKYSKIEKAAIGKLNYRFNRLSLSVKKWSVVIFGIASALVCLATVRGLFSVKLSRLLQGQSISTPIIEHPMKQERENESLIPLGKMKGEIDGEFDSFYVAVDKDARIFINRNMNYGDSAYKKSENWNEITIDILKDYERSLHFIPLSQKSKGLKQ